MYKTERKQAEIKGYNKAIQDFKKIIHNFSCSDEYLNDEIKDKLRFELLSLVMKL